MIRIRWIPARSILVTACLLSVALLGSVFTPTAAHAQGDNRTAVSLAARKAPPYSAVVRLEVGAGNDVRQCSGSIIDDDSVLTAAHCLSNPNTGLLRLPRNIKVFYGGNDGAGDWTYDAKERSCVARWRYIAPEYPQLLWANFDHDYGVVNVACWRQTPGQPAGVGTYDAKFPKSLGRFQLSATPETPGNLNGRVSYTAGFPRDKGTLMFRAQGVVTASSARTFDASLGATGGQSGSPVWGSIGGCTNCAFGVLSRATATGVSNPTIFTRITPTARDRIRSWAAGNLLILVDCTDSMGGVGPQVAAKVGGLMAATPQGTKVAVACWRDPAAPQVLQAFTSDPAPVRAAILNASYSGGGDTEEDPLGALAEAPAILPWNSNTSADVLLVTDTIGKDPSPTQGLTGAAVVSRLLAGPTNTTSDGDFGGATISPAATATQPAPTAVEPTPAVVEPPRTAVDSSRDVQPASTPPIPAAAEPAPVNAAPVPAVPLDTLPVFPDPVRAETPTYPAPDVLPRPITASVAVVNPGLVTPYLRNYYVPLVTPTGGTAVVNYGTDAVDPVLQTITTLPLVTTTGWTAGLTAQAPVPTTVTVSGRAEPTTEACPTDADLPARAFTVILTSPVTDPAKVTWFSDEAAQFTTLRTIAGPNGVLPAVATFGRTNTVLLCFPGAATLPGTDAEVAAHLRLAINS